MYNDEEVLTATMIRFVEQPRFKMDLISDGGKRVRLLSPKGPMVASQQYFAKARKIRVPARLIELLRSDLPLPDKKHKLDQIILRYSNHPSPFMRIFVKYFLKLSLFRLHKRDSEEHPTIQIVNDHVSEMNTEEVDLFNIKGTFCQKYEVVACFN